MFPRLMARRVAVCKPVMNWLILIYRLPGDRSTGRVHVWRRLRRIGAQYLQDGVCILPADDRCREQFQWLAAEIGEMAGSAQVIEGILLSPQEQSAIVERFREQARAAYGEVRATLAEVCSSNPVTSEQDDSAGRLMRQAWRLYAAARQVDWFAVNERECVHQELVTLTREMEQRTEEDSG